jgi:hypothetical protein
LVIFIAIYSIFGWFIGPKKTNCKALKALSWQQKLHEAAEAAQTATKKPPNKKYQKINGKHVMYDKYIGKNYIIQHPRVISVQQNHIVKQQDVEKVKILKGEFKNYVGQIIRSQPAYLSVYIDSLGKQMSSYVDKFGKTQKLEPTDVFYIDLILANGNAFQVNSINSQGLIKGIEKTLQGYEAKTINQSDIARLQPGFKFHAHQSVSQEEFDSQNLLQEEVVTSEVEDRDDVSEPEEDGFYKDQEESNLEYDEPQFVSSFKDQDRVTFQNIKLNKSQEEIKRVIEKIFLNIVGRSIAEELVVSDFIIHVDEILNITKEKLQSSSNMQNNWTPGDKRVIISCMAFRHLVKNDYAYFISQSNLLNTFIDMLINKQIINRKHVENNIFLQNEWTSAFSIPMFKLPKQFEEIIYIIFQNCYDYLNSIDDFIEIPTFNNSKTTDESQFLKVEKISKEPPRKYAYASEVINNAIPSTAIKVLWAPRFQNVFVEYHKLLDTRVKALEEKGKENSIQKQNYINSAKVYAWVNENLQQAPFVLKDLDMSMELAEEKKQALEKVFKVLLTAISQVENEFQSRRSEIMLEKESTKNTILEKRKRVLPPNDMNDMDDELEKELNYLTINPKKKLYKR